MPGSLCYLLAAIAAAVVCTALLSKSRNGDITRRGAVASAVTAVWALVLAGQGLVGARTAWITLLMEAIRYGAWFGVLRALAPASPGWLKHVSLALVAALISYAVLG